MKPIARAIRKATGLTLREFCETQLNSKWVTFSVRLRKNRLYPNEYIFICLVTKQKFTDLFGTTFNHTLLFRGDESVTSKINGILKDSGEWDRLNRLIRSPLDLSIQAPAYIDEAEIIAEMQNVGVTEHSNEEILHSVMAKAADVPEPATNEAPVIGVAELPTVTEPKQKAKSSILKSLYEETY
jgi:hypothetical protein